MLNHSGYSQLDLVVVRSLSQTMQGCEFVNAVQAEVYKLTGTEHCVSPAYHASTNYERFNQTLQTALVKLVNNTQNDWDEHISPVLFAYRTAKQKATKLSPFEVMYCR